MAREFSKIFADHASEVYLVHGRDRGRAAWYYLRVDKPRLPLFLGMCRRKEKDAELTEFGEVLASGWGEEPPPDIRARFETPATPETGQQEWGRGFLLYLLQGDDISLRRIYTYLAVPLHLIEAFERAANGQEPWNMEDYGIRVMAGFGDPTPEVMQTMQSCFGANHQRITNPATPLPIFTGEEEPAA